MSERSDRAEDASTYLRDAYPHASSRVSSEIDDLLSRLGREASFTWYYLVAGWRRRRRLNRGVDTNSLKSALNLEAYCTEVSADSSIVLLPNTNQLRYELLAGALVVQQLLPFPAADRPTLRDKMQAWHRGKVAWRTEPSKEQVELVDHWQAWLRRDGKIRAPIGAEMHGEASLVAAAAYRINTALSPDGPDYIYSGLLDEFEDEEVGTLVRPIERPRWRRSELLPGTVYTE